MSNKPTLEAVLNWLYEQEQNVMLTSFWDGGWRISLGDYSNGFVHLHEVRDLRVGAEWLLDEWLKLHPDQRDAAAKAGLIREGDGVPDLYIKPISFRWQHKHGAWRNWFNSHGWQSFYQGGSWDHGTQRYETMPNRVFGWTFHLGPLKVCFGDVTELAPWRSRRIAALPDATAKAGLQKS